MNGLADGIVLDELDQPVAEDHLAGRRREVLSDLEGIDADRHAPAGRTLGIFDEIPGAAQEIAAAFREGLAQDLGVGRDEVGRRDHVEHLPRREFEDALVAFRHAVHAGRGVMPPVLAEKEGLRNDVEGPLLPLGAAEAPILRQVREVAAGVPWVLRCRVPGEMQGEAHGLQRAGVPQVHLPAGRESQMRHPVEIGIGERHRRQAEREARNEIVQRPVGHFAKMLRRVEIQRLQLRCAGTGRGRRRGAGMVRVGSLLRLSLIHI